MQPFRLSVFFAIIFFTTTKTIAQTPMKKYEKEWKQVEAFQQKLLPKSALEQVKKIYQLAKKEKQEAQVIKSLIYISQLQQEIREENEEESIKEFEKEIALAKEPSASILHSILAQMYWQYFKQHRWLLYDRSNTADFDKKDIATWTADDLHKKMGELYLESIKNAKILQQTKLDEFNAIIINGNMRHLRPTLYDLLAHRALEYFKSDESDITRPAYSFEIDKASAFDAAGEFVKREFVTNDSLSLHHKALLIYQQLLSFHLNDAKPDALIDADIDRIEFVNQYSVHPDKKNLYLAALQHIANKYKDDPAAAQAWFLIAKQYNQDANSYQPNGDTTHRFDRVKAKEILQRIIAQKDSSEGKINAYNLLQEITRKNLLFSVEKVNLPAQPFRVLVEYKNIDQLYLRLITADKLKEELENYWDEKSWTKITSATALKNWQQPLPATNDLQQHTVEIKIDALDAGEYFLLAATTKDFNPKNSLLGARLFYVSNISYVNNGENYFVLHRQSGQPLKNATVQIWQRRYDYKLSKYVKEKSAELKTDDQGFFLFKKPTQESSYSFYYSIDVSYNNDRLFMADYEYDYYYPNDRNEPKENLAVYLFADRSIYRPGQTIYFKGIAINSMHQEKRNEIKSNYKTIIYLRDANGQTVDSMQVSTNEYGSFSGKFQLPQTGLTGQFSLLMKDNKGEIDFSVEEYKRPKFFVDYEKIKGSYKVNDNIKITGFAKAYAGNNIDGALVKYRVVREPRFIYPWMFWKWWMPLVKEMEIAHGEIKTDKEGKFTIEFTAIPDLTIDKKFDPVFDYTVYTDVTDINGETRSGEETITAGYKSLLLHVTLPKRISTDSLKNISITTTNMAGEFEPATVKVNISKLKEEKRLIRERYWQRPDQFVMSKQEYISLFPHDEYDNETDPKTWAKEKTIFERAAQTDSSSQFPVTNNQFTPGFYSIEVTAKDKDGAEVKDVVFIEVYDEKTNRLALPEYLWTEGSKPIEPGEKTTIKIGTSAEDVFVIQETDKSTSDKTQTPNYKLSNLSNEIKGFEFGATEAGRGGYGVNFFFVKDNRFYQTNNIIAVPWTNKELQIEWATFRDKTLPGSEEKWKVKIKGYKNEKVAAEMLASMYDASLDQFRMHAWSKPGIWPYYSSYRSWKSSMNFSEVKANQHAVEQRNWKSLDKRYDELINQTPGYRIYSRLYKVSGDIAVNHYRKETAPVAQKNEEKDGDINFLTTANTTKMAVKQKPSETRTDNSSTHIRKNFQETAFFFPELHTDAEGNIEFSFTAPEALTKWKLQTLAHTKDLAFGFSTKELITQKQLMVQPNAPRFLRQGDRMEFSSKIVNLTEKEITGQAELQLFDATTNQPVDGWLMNSFPTQYFTVAAGQSEVVKFPIQVPMQLSNALVWRIVASAKTDSATVSDGEENVLPVLTNKILVTETMPINLRGVTYKNFRFEKLLNSGNSQTLQHHALIVEYTSNPAWYAVQALPYLMEYPYDCAEQTWNCYYANSLAGMIANSSPRIKQIFEQWKTKDTTALLSNLQKNQELKAALLEETPWVLEAKTEEQQKKNIALLFDMVKMSTELNTAFEKLKQMQSENGGFVWFKGGPDDRYITQYIVTGIGHLQKLKATTAVQDKQLATILHTALPYLDKKIKEDYDWLVKQKVKLADQNIGFTQIQYLYMRSFFKTAIPKEIQTAYNYYRGQAQKFWTKQNKYMQGMIALALYRTGEEKTTADILRSLKETSVNHEELGMYWKDQSSGWFWWQAPIETQALLIEVFAEAAKDVKTVDDLKTWLLKNKQTNNWQTTKATAEACYALLLQGSLWLADEPTVEIKLGNLVLNQSNTGTGTGYFKKTIEEKNVKPEMGNINVAVTSPSGKTSTSWGAVYWQYFEDMDKVTTASTPLKLVKKLFVEKNTDRGSVLKPVKENDELKVGDKIKVRIELCVDRDMEYVHMKDMRASALEPVNVLSGYRWQGGLGYYEATRDASTNFFFDYLRKGTYVFEYSLFVTHAGNFSNGITTIQCMYAPEFSSHSEGTRISVVE
ncbi:MAG: alpha-2-macroglobulin [Chitinophagaceae bacterium]